MFAAQICLMNKCGSALMISVSMAHLYERHYNSALSIWLSVDPMSDKYPSTSPYTYCGNNPVRLVDPNGEDIWEIDEFGKITNQYEDKNIDQFYIVDSKGNCIARSETYKAGTFNVMANEQGKTLFNVNGEIDNDLCSSFEFFADNMDIEWESITTTDGKMYLGTSQCTDHTGIFNDIEARGESISIHCHNHPSGNPQPSGIDSKTGDITFASKRPNMKCYIYTRKEGYTEYDKNTRPEAILLEGITVNPRSLLKRQR